MMERGWLGVGEVIAKGHEGTLGDDKNIIYLVGGNITL